eukprot:1448020-Alexandrium_andersonii.AAC.1
MALRAGLSLPSPCSVPPPIGATPATPAAPSTLAVPNSTSMMRCAKHVATGVCSPAPFRDTTLPLGAQAAAGLVLRVARLRPRRPSGVRVVQRADRW